MPFDEINSRRHAFEAQCVTAYNNAARYKSFKRFKQVYGNTVAVRLGWFNKKNGFYPLETHFFDGVDWERQAPA